MAVASSFLGMHKQIEEISDEDDDTMLGELLANTVLSHAENPCNIIGDIKNYDYPLLCLLGGSKIKVVAKVIGLTKGKEMTDSAIKVDSSEEFVGDLGINPSLNLRLWGSEGPPLPPRYPPSASATLV